MGTCRQCGSWCFAGHNHMRRFEHFAVTSIVVWYRGHHYVLQVGNTVWVVCKIWWKCWGCFRVPGALSPCVINTHTHTRLTALCPGLTGWAGPRKVKPIWILLEQETLSGSGISWTICKSAPCARQITTPAPTTQFCTGRMPFLPPNQQCQSTHIHTKSFQAIIQVNMFAFSASTLLIEHHEEHPACKNRIMRWQNAAWFTLCSKLDLL